ncbi:MAG: ferritin family protein [Desulfobacterales bacterium]
MFRIGEILDLAVRIEQNGEKTYRTARERFGDENLVELLSWMADEEARHAAWFGDLRRRVESGRGNPFLEEMTRKVLDDLVAGRSFSLEEVDFAAIPDPARLIEVFLGFEQDTVLFYEILSSFVEEEATARHLETIIAEERRHIERLEEVRRELEQAAEERR